MSWPNTIFNKYFGPKVIFSQVFRGQNTIYSKYFGAKYNFYYQRIILSKHIGHRIGFSENLSQKFRNKGILDTS